MANRPRRSDEAVSPPFALQGRLLLGAGAGAVEGTLVVDGGKIVSVETPTRTGESTSDDVAHLPLSRRAAPFIAPGFIDLQTNGSFGFEVGDDPDALRRLAARLPSTGVTGFLPTLVSRRQEGYARALSAFDAAGAVPGSARILGLHLEGPLLSPDRAGAHDRAAIDAATAALLDRLADPTHVRLVTLAPERPDALALIRKLRARGVLVSLGHTNASFDTFTAAVDAGATLATHLFNAMAPFHHRAPGATGAALTDDRVTALAIADGVHTHPAALRLAVRAKGFDRLALVTDAIAGAGLPPGPTVLGGQAVIVDAASARLADGTLAGSTLTLDQAVRNMVAFGPLAEAAAVHLVTTMPARILGLENRGRLAVGADADIVLLDEHLRVLATYIGGVLVFSRNPGDTGAV